MNKITKLISTSILALSMFNPVFADGVEPSTCGEKKTVTTQCRTEYGGGTVCEDVVVTENIPCDDVLENFQEEGLPDTGVAEIAAMATVAFFGGLLAFVMAQREAKA